MNEKREKKLGGDMGMSGNRSQWLRYFLISSAVGFAAPSFAGGVEAKTTYSINTSNTEAKTELKNAPPNLDEKFKEKLWDKFAEKLKDMPLVGDVQISDVVEKKTDPGTWADYMQVSKNFSAFVQLNLDKPITLLFSVEQMNQVCKPAGQSSGTITSSCADLNTTLAIKGPIAVYGTFETESNMDVDGMLRDKQRLNIQVSRSYDKTTLVLDSTMYVESMLFEKSLLKFFDIYHVNGISKKNEDLTRQSIFLGVARVMRQSNERMLEL
jgi:hypothetical protein